MLQCYNVTINEFQYEREPRKTPPKFVKFELAQPNLKKTPETRKSGISVHGNPIPRKISVLGFLI